MRQPTDQERKDYRYVVSFVIDVKRTDNQLLTADENTMVEEMRAATESTIAAVMAKHGNNNHKNLGNAKVIY